MQGPSRRLVGASHFHQAAHRHPVGHVLQSGLERVELVTGGRGWVRSEDAWHEVGPGDLLWHCAGDQTIARSDFTDPYRCLALHFELTDAGAARPAPHRSRWDDLDAVRSFTDRVLHDFVDERFPIAVVGDYAFAVLRYRAHAWVRRQRAGDLPAGIQRALRRLEEDYAEDLTTGDLAALAGWSEAHLHAEFRRHLQTTPHQYLIQRRLRAARALLTTTRSPIAEVAATCGIADPGHFSRAFRKAVGCSPSEYRRRHEHPEFE